MAKLLADAGEREGRLVAATGEREERLAVRLLTDAEEREKRLAAKLLAVEAIETELAQKGKWELEQWDNLSAKKWKVEVYCFFYR